MVVLRLLIADSYIEEKGCKKGMIRLGGPHYVKMAFALLTKMIAVHI